MLKVIAKARNWGAMAVTMLASAVAKAEFSPNVSGGDSADTLNVQKGNLMENVVSLINWFLGFLGFIAVALVIYAGIIITTAQGNPEKVKKGNKIITYAVIGLIVVALAYGIVNFIIAGIVENTSDSGSATTTT